MVQKMLKVIRAGITEGILGDAKDRRAGELKCLSELGALWKERRHIVEWYNEVTEDIGHITARKKELQHGCW